MIWFDLDNSPHVPIFRPILKELRSRGIDFIVTARDYAQTKSLLELWNIEHTMIGVHGGKSKAGKITNLIGRTNQLVKFAKGKKVSAAFSHGSRTQVMAARRFGIPSYVMLDYEYTEKYIFNLFGTKLLIPDLIPDARLAEAGFNTNKVIRYPGYKENIYLQDFVPERNFRERIGIPADKILVVIRPPALLGNYHNSESEKLFTEAIRYFSSNKNTQTLIISRTKEDVGLVHDLSNSGNISLLEKPVDGLQLLFSADITLSGGGTMNRESALLGTSTYSIFTGRKPYLDEHLQSLGKLKFIENSEDLRSICIEKKKNKEYFKNSDGIKYIIEFISNIHDKQNRRLDESPIR
ncbi:MAG TPA: DUF354 domain-containing protein [Ignavibacteria bacterium]|nr:DUF354 domain-containing protein [Ignavibacteria bacterium]